MTEREEYLESLLCAIMFDLGQTRHLCDPTGRPRHQWGEWVRINFQNIDAVYEFMEQTAFDYSQFRDRMNSNLRKLLVP